MANTNYDVELYELLEEAIASGELDEENDRAAIGVARAVIDVGYHSLTPKQRALYDAKVIPAITEVAAEWKKNEMLNRHSD